MRLWAVTVVSPEGTEHVYCRTSLYSEAILAKQSLQRSWGGAESDHGHWVLIREDEDEPAKGGEQ